MEIAGSTKTNEGRFHVLSTDAVAVQLGLGWFGWKPTADELMYIYREATKYYINYK